MTQTRRTEIAIGILMLSAFVLYGVGQGIITAAPQIGLLIINNTTYQTGMFSLGIGRVFLSWSMVVGKQLPSWLGIWGLVELHKVRVRSPL